MPNDILRNKATKLKNFTSLKNLKLVEHDLEFFLSSSNDHKTTLISQWENEKKLSKSDTESLRNTVDLLRVTGSNVDLIAAFSKEGISKTEDLITHDKASLAGIMRRNNINAPESKNINSYAEEVLSKAEAEHSSAFFLHRVIEKPELLDLEVSLRPSPSNKLKEFHKNNNTFDLKNEPIISLETGELNVKIQGISKPTPDLIKELSYAQQSLQLSRDTNMAALLFKKEINIRKAAMTTHQTLMRELGIDASAAIEIKQKAQYYHEATVNGFFAYRDIISNPFLRNTLENLKPVKDAIFKGMGKDINWGKVKEINGLKDVDSIEDLFGSQNYCECESCKSVLSPAAYFVDLMRFIEKRVLYQKSGALEVKILQDTHPIHLKVRRPDLWTLKLTCENTNKRIPYIEIVNEAIAAFIEKHLGASKSISERLIEEQPDLEFLLPYNQYLDEVRTWLSYFGLQRLELLEYLYPLPDLNEKLMLAIESLSLSKEQYEIIVNQNLSAKVDTDVLSFRRKSDLNSEDTEQLTKMKFWENKLSIIQKKDTGDIQKYHIEFSSTLTNWQGKLPG